MTVEITKKDFSTDEIIKKINCPEIGCVVTFVGIVRGSSRKGSVETLEIEAYDEMGKNLLLEIVEKAKSEFKIQDVYIIHRIGKLKVGDKIICIAISAAHRKDAFKACEWMINGIKEIVPIWKKESYSEFK